MGVKSRWAKPSCWRRGKRGEEEEEERIAVAGTRETIDNHLKKYVFIDQNMAFQDIESSFSLTASC
jgi:hypothetical protein